MTNFNKDLMDMYEDILETIPDDDEDHKEALRFMFQRCWDYAAIMGVLEDNLPHVFQMHCGHDGESLPEDEEHNHAVEQIRLAVEALKSGSLGHANP